MVGPELVGRETELAEIEACLNGTAAGTAHTLVVSGDPGIGKTALVRQACASMASKVLVLSGAGLPLASVNIPFLALRSAFRGVSPPVGISSPTFGKSVDIPQDEVVSIDAWLTELCRIRPVVLVVDDLQWTDQGTLDVLMYLIAGPADRHLSILTTLRSGTLGDGHPLRRWLADILRMPRTSQLTLGPLDYPSTGTQMALVLGAEPHQSLVREVFTHTAGNAYLNQLLLGGLRPDSRHLPGRLPTDLRSAVLRSWGGLSADAREATQVLAVAGHPTPARDLEVVMHHGGRRYDASAGLREAADAGITECEPNGLHWWFHHPLIAEVLEQGLDGQQRRDWNAVFAAHEERRLGDGASDFASLAALAHHHDVAGHTAEAFEWTLRASTAALEAGGAGDTVPLLRRALALQGRLGHDGQEREVLLMKLRGAADVAGAIEDELEVVEELLVEFDAADRPLDVAELMVRRAHLRFSTGREFLVRSPMTMAVQLASADAESWQYAFALAELAHVELWESDPAAEGHAAEALAVAEKSENPRALSYALTANVMAAVLGGRDAAEGRRMAARAVESAAQARDFWAMVHATLWQANATEAWTSQAFADLMRAGRNNFVALGAPHAYIAKMAAEEAGSYMAIGRWKECSQALRVALGSDPGIMGDVGVRLTAARLALWQGRMHEAQAHLARAEELYEQKSEFLNLEFDAVRAEVYLATGDPAAAYASALNGANPDHLSPTMCEWLIPLAARSLADRIQSASDQGHPTADLLALTADLVERFPHTLQDFGLETELYAAQVKAFDQLYRAEVGRARCSPENGQHWIRAADACRVATVRWEETYCCWRAVEALLLRGHSQRGLATSLLRRGLSLADELQARPIQASLNELATRARIPTTLPSVEESVGRSSELPGLTAREREILGYVIAGRTYGEIARSLVISEKTVSSHISNMLRKTGTANRLDLSRFATRRGSDRATRDHTD